MSYYLASGTLEELCQISISHTKIGNIADAVGEEIAKRQEHCPSFRAALRESFQSAQGETEFQIDGTCIHILNADGTREWREFKLGSYAKRLVCESAFPWEWATRKLHKPTVVSSFALIANKEAFQARCQEERRRIGVGGITSALGDGAVWIWSIIREIFGKTEECLDIYHALERVSNCGKGLYGTGQSFKGWLDKVRLVLLSEGFEGIERELSALKGELKGNSKKAKSHRDAIESLRKYLSNNSGRLPYAERLEAGRAIGSGLIEGACKNLVGRRMKQTGACWRIERANRIAVLSAAIYADNWKL
jgi:hypothetical protein